MLSVLPIDNQDIPEALASIESTRDVILKLSMYLAKFQHHLPPVVYQEVAECLERIEDLACAKLEALEEEEDERVTETA